VREKRFGTIEMTDAMKFDLRYTLVSKTMLADDYFSVDIYEFSDVSRCDRCMLSSGSWTYLCFDDGLAVGLSCLSTWFKASLSREFDKDSNGLSRTICLKTNLRP